MLFVTWHEGTLTVFAVWGAHTEALLAWIASGAALGPLAGRILHRPALPGPRDGEAADDGSTGPLAADDGPEAAPADPDASRALGGPYGDWVRSILPADHRPGAPACPCNMCAWQRSYERDTREP